MLTPPEIGNWISLPVKSAVTLSTLIFITFAIGIEAIHKPSESVLVNSVLIPTKNEIRSKREVEAAPVTYSGLREEEIDKYISFNELSDVDRFSSSNVLSYRSLLFDIDNYQVIVGARDYIYRLSLTGFHLLESSNWSPDAETTQLCKMKGQDSYHCHNFITLLEKNNSGALLACGTNAFRPLCSWRSSLSSISVLTDSFRGVGQAPFDPSLSGTHLMTANGDLFTGTFLDFHGRDPAFMRSFGHQQVLRTSQYDYKWFSKPNFVASFESGGFIYFFFREEGVEYLNCRQQSVPRIGRVCKNDPGGNRMQSERWTTFLKASLDCSAPGDTPFHYDSLQSVTYLRHEEMFYGLFTTQSNGVAGTALCAFNMSAVNRSFDGALKYQSNPHSTWRPVVENMSHYKCEFGDPSSGGSTSVSNLNQASINANKYQIMDATVQAIDTRPVYSLHYERLTHIAVDVVPTRQSGSVHVLYLANSDGTIRKVSVVPRSSQTALTNRNSTTTCLLEVLAPFPSNVSAKIHTMKFLRDTYSLYVGTETEVLRVPVRRCQRYKTRSACLAAHDPYCGWNRNLLECTPPPNQRPFESSWVQEVIDCPTNTEPIDGGWSRWSNWHDCRQKDSEEDSCQCRRRTCDAPAPARGGVRCQGPDTEVSNCTVHGGWTSWSAWSQCSATCGVAVKFRRRSCTNPAPQYGGRICVGPDHYEIYCHQLPPCPVTTNLPVAGGWSSWSDWGMCSTNCGKGTQTRTRLCNNPRPKHGGAPCSGCDNQTESCLGQNCSALERHSDWTSWMIPIDSGSGGNSQTRFRVACSVSPDDASGLEITAKMDQEKRRCSDSFGSEGDDGCTDIAREGSDGWEPWSEWSRCDRECGTGQQTRWRVCANTDCSGAATQNRACNTHPCRGQWSCWSEWSLCTLPCSSAGIRKRSRICLASHRPLLEASDCKGVNTEENTCEHTQCEVVPPGEEGWSQWSGWSSCSVGADFSVRSRICASDQPSTCRGLDHQRKPCLTTEQDLKMLESRTLTPESTISSGVSVGSLIGACVTCFLLGIVIGCLIMHAYAVRLRKRQVPSSPHYLSVKPNQYVSVPGAQWKSDSKQQQQMSMSPTATLKNSLKRQNSTRDPYTTLPLKDIDATATIKRSSHSSYGNGQLRADLDSDTIFNF